MATVTLSIANAPTGITLTWTTSGQTGGDTVQIISSLSPDMTSPTVDLSGLTLGGGSQLLTLAVRHPRFYQAQVMNGVSVDQSSAILFGLSTGTAVSKMPLTPWQDTAETPLNSAKVAAIKGGGIGPAVYGFGGGDTGAAAAISPSIGVVYTKFWTTDLWNPAADQNAQLGWRIASGAYTPSTYDNDGVQACCRSLDYRALVLGWIAGTPAGREQALPVNGFFCDNGWSDGSDVRQICTNPSHSHNCTEDLGHAFAHLLIDAICAIKLLNPDAICGVNGGALDVAAGANGDGYTGPFFYGYDLADCVDFYSWEAPAFLQNGSSSQAFTGGSGQHARGIARQNQSIAHFVRWVFIDYPNTNDKAFYSFALAGLFNMGWGANLGNSGKSGHNGFFPTLLAVRLGDIAGGYTPGGTQFGSTNCWYQDYANGFVVLNPNPSPVTISLPSSSPNLQRDVTDLYANMVLSAPTSLTIPANAGRIYQFYTPSGQNAGASRQIGNRTATIRPAVTRTHPPRRIGVR